MEKVYLVTGATGFLGREVAKQLTAQHKKVIGLRLPGDKAHLSEKGQVICEPKQFSASRVKGIYGKSKAEATAYVQKASERRLYAMIVHPSGMIGPEDYSGGYMTETIKAYLKGYFPCAVEEV